ncbi:MAG: head decoration protein [Proteobacteria bacterium]|nr:head decoration protein [Pseudomonadota bacterium]
METATYDPNDLRVGSYPVASQTVTFASGQNIVRGAVLGKITASGKYVLSASAASDGSQVPIAIAAVAVDATAADTPGPVLLTGEYDASKLVFGAGHDAASVEASLRSRGQAIFLKTL